MENAQPTPELEKAVESEGENAVALYATAAVYETVDRAKSSPWMEPLWTAEPETGAVPVAVTFFVATIGPGLEEELAAALTRGEGLRSQILTALGEESAEQAANFLTRLVGDEAKEEACELSPRFNVTVPELQRQILLLLGSDKIQIQMDNVGHLSPRFTKIGHLLWWPPSKRRKPTEKK